MPTIRKTKKILIIYNEDFPWDIRIDKFCNSLTSNKYQVHLLCNNKQNRPISEAYEKISIHRLPRLRPSFLKIAVFCNPIWLFKGYILAKRKRVDAVMIRDLPLALTGIMIGRMLNIPVTYDMAENYPEAAQIWKKTGEYQGFINKALRNYPIFKLTEKIACRFSDLIFVVVKENKIRLERMGIPSEKIRIIENTPSLDTLKTKGHTANRHRNVYHNAFVIIYIGGLQYHRGLLDAIMGMRYVIDKAPQARLLIVGDGLQKRAYEKKVEELNLGEYVSFAGYIDFPLVFNYIHLSQVCIVPHIRSKHTDTTMPNKVYDYMSLGKAVLVSDALPLWRLVNEERCGIAFRSGDPKDFAEKVLELHSDPGKRAEMGSNGRSAVLRRYNWGVDERVLLESINRLL